MNKQTNQPECLAAVSVLALAGWAAFVFFVVLPFYV